MPKQQYSLRRLLVCTVLFFGVLAAAVNFPILVASLITTKLLLFAPAIGVGAVAMWISRNRRRTLTVVFIGAFAGSLFAPSIMVTRVIPPTFWDHFLIDFNTIGIFSGVWALVFAILEWIIANSSRRPT